MKQTALHSVADNNPIRNMIRKDWAAVKLIYESGISTGIATFEISVPTWEQWDNSHLKFGRLVVIVNDKVAGWTALSPVSSRRVYSGVAEVSIYVDQGSRGKGVGKQLLQQLIVESEANEIWTLQARIFKENIASIRLHQCVGFRVIGFSEKIGKLNGVWKDNVILERRSRIVGTTKFTLLDLFQKIFLVGLPDWFGLLNSVMRYLG